MTRALLTLVAHDLRQHLRDRSMLLFALVIPFALAFVFSLAFAGLSDLELDPVTVAVAAPEGDEPAAAVVGTLQALPEQGVPVTVLTAAADEVRTGRRTAVQAETVTATHVIVEHWVERPFSEEAWEDTVALLRSRFGVDMGMWYGRSGEGRVERVGRAHEWSHLSQWGTETRVSVSERGGKTRLLLSQRVGYASPKVEGVGYGALLGLAAWLVGLMASSMFGGSELFLFLLVATVILTAVVVAPRLAQKRRGNKQRGLKALAADIEEVFEAVSAQANPISEAENDSVPMSSTSPRKLSRKVRKTSSAPSSQ